VGDSGFEADWLVVDYRPLAEESWDAFVVQYYDPRQPATAVKSGPGRRRFEFMRLANVTPEELAQEATAWRLMAPWGVTPDTAELERHAVYTFRGRWAQTWRVGQTFLAGDAAHLMPPFMGQGLCAGLRDARALAWRLGMVHTGAAHPAVLDSYGPERSGHVQEIIEEAVAAGRVICELDPQRAAVRDAEMRQQMSEPGTTEEPPHPRLGDPSITLSSRDVEGRLAPQGLVTVGDWTEQVTVVLSHYLPGGQADMSPQPVETVYVLVSGELVMLSDGQEATLAPYDSVHFTPGTVRQVVNRSKLPASMLVIRPAAA